MASLGKAKLDTLPTELCPQYYGNNLNYATNFSFGDSNPSNLIVGLTWLYWA